MLRNPFARREAQPSGSWTYADVFEVMRYDRATDVLPYAIAYRPKPPHVDPSGPEPHFALLDSEAEFEAFWDVMNGPLVFEPSGAVAVAPLNQWNEKPSRFTTELSLTSFYHPDDESQDWPVMWLRALTSAELVEGLLQPEDTKRGRYAVLQFPLSEKQRFMDQLVASSSAGPLIFINGKVPGSVFNVLNPRTGKTQ